MKYVLSAGSAAVLLTLQALSVGGWQYALLWPALSLYGIALAYIGLGPSIFGKQSDGSMHLVNRLVMLPFCVPYEIAWKLYLSRQKPVGHLIVPGIWLGRRPGPDEIPDGVQLLIDVTAEFQSFAALRTNYTYWTLPTLDARSAKAPILKEFATRIANWSQGDIYIHCAKGRGRSTTLLVAVLIERGLAQDIDEAIDLIRSKRPQVRLHAPQRQVLESLYEKNSA